VTIIKFGCSEIALIIGRKSVLMESESDAVNVQLVGGQIGCLQFNIMPIHRDVIECPD